MGYTHYWSTSRPLPQAQWDEFSARCKNIVQAAWKQDINIALDYDEPNSVPEFSDKYVHFNGVEDEGHETFSIKRNRIGGDFCKTARKPYDAAVVACLMEGTRIFGVDTFSWSSDGDGEPGSQEEAQVLLDSLDEEKETS